MESTTDQIAEALDKMLKARAMMNSISDASTDHALPLSHEFADTIAKYEGNANNADVVVAMCLILSVLIDTYTREHKFDPKISISAIAMLLERMDEGSHPPSGASVN